MTTIQEFHKNSIENPEAFWGEEAKLIDWHKPFSKVLDFVNGVVCRFAFA